MCNVLFFYSKDVHGQSVLHFAAKSGNVKCLELLLECGVSIHDKVREGGREGGRMHVHVCLAR